MDSRIAPLDRPSSHGSFRRAEDLHVSVMESLGAAGPQYFGKPANPGAKFAGFFLHILSFARSSLVQSQRSRPTSDKWDLLSFAPVERTARWMLVERLLQVP